MTDHDHRILWCYVGDSTKLVCMDCYFMHLFWGDEVTHHYD